MTLQMNLHGDGWVLARAPAKSAGPNWKEAIPCSVPGNIVIDLYQAGLVADPYFGENFRGCKWVDQWTFWYRKTFMTPEVVQGAEKANYYLQFDGLDTFTEIYLNGKSIGKTHNMFMRHRFDITGLVRNQGVNELIVRIDPVSALTIEYADKHGIDLSALGPVAFGYTERVIARKAQMSYGWDQTPHLLAGGIFRNVYLQVCESSCLGEWGWNVCELNLEAQTCILYLQGDVNPFQDEHGELSVSVAGQCQTSSFSGKAKVVEGKWSTHIQVQDARFWWPLALGPANLYKLDIRLEASDGRLLDQRDAKIGLRTFEVITEPKTMQIADYRIGRPDKTTVMDSGSNEGPWTRIPLVEPVEVEVSAFNARVNGENVFLKGFNWQNPEALFGCERADKVERLLDYAVSANANMLRLWGGGTIEIDEFYEMCSAKGIMVWQDFYYACAIYPTDNAAFQQEARIEAADMIARLRNHTCLAMWCGDNESDMIYHDRGMDPQTNVLNKVILPEMLRRYDIQKRYYHPSSPSGGPYPRSDWGGDKRNWGACSPEDNYRHVRQENTRMMSEGGYYTLPALDSIRKFMPIAFEWPLNNSTWALHNGSVDRTLNERKFLIGIEKCINYFDRIDSLEKAVEVSQFAHAWGTKLIAERCRQRKYDCGGVLLWKLNATWPCADGMAVDYYLKPLPSLLYIREAYKPVSVSITQHFEDTKADVTIYVSNDLLREVRSKLMIFIAEAGSDGRLTQVLGTQSKDLIIPVNSSRLVSSIAVRDLNHRDVVFGAILELADVQEAAVGLFSLEPRAIYRALKAHDFDQHKLCRSAVAVNSNMEQAFLEKPIFGGIRYE